MTRSDSIAIITERLTSLDDERVAILADVARKLSSPGDAVVNLSDNERQLVREGVAELDRGEYASGEDVEALLRRPWEAPVRPRALADSDYPVVSAKPADHPHNCHPGPGPGSSVWRVGLAQVATFGAVHALSSLRYSGSQPKAGMRIVRMVAETTG